MKATLEQESRERIASTPRPVTRCSPEPVDPDEYERWVSERRDAAVLLAALADHDCDLLRRTAVGEWVSSATQDLLLAATQEWCANLGGRGNPTLPRGADQVPAVDAP